MGMNHIGSHWFLVMRVVLYWKKCYDTDNTVMYSSDCKHDSTKPNHILLNYSDISISSPDITLC